MTNPIDKLRDLLSKKQLEDDGSRELAQGWLDLLSTSKEMQGLLVNPAFQHMLERMKKDFIVRMAELVDKDPELKAIKRMFIRTVGMKGAEERVKKLVVEYLEEPIETP